MLAQFNEQITSFARLDIGRSRFTAKRQKTHVALYVCGLIKKAIIKVDLFMSYWENRGIVFWFEDILRFDDQELVQLVSV